MVANGVAGAGVLSAALPVCSSVLYTVNAVLLPATTLALVPTVNNAGGPHSSGCACR